MQGSKNKPKTALKMDHNTHKRIEEQRSFKKKINPNQNTTCNLRIGIYPGSFDPLTNGHINVISRALKVVDKLIVSVGFNSNKKYLFDKKERVLLTQQTLLQELGAEKFQKIEIATFEGLLVDFAQEQKASLIIRGIRALSDFDFEFSLAGMNSKLNSEIETIFLITSENTQFISSTFVKEIAMLKGDVTKLVPQNIKTALEKRFRK